LEHEHRGNAKLRPIVSARLERASKMIDLLKDDPIPEEAREDFWRLTTLIGNRRDEERDTLDALCCLMHRALDLGLDPAATISAMSAHVERETGQKLKPSMTIPKEDLASSADRLVIRCLETGDLWNETYGWVDRITEATTYDPEMVATISLPGGDCDVAQISELRDLLHPN